MAHPNADEPAASSIGARIDHLCERFEAELRAGRNPRFADYLADQVDPLRKQLYYELVKLQREYHKRQRGRAHAGRNSPTELPQGTCHIPRDPIKLLITLKVESGPSSGRAFTFDEHDTFIVGRYPLAHLQVGSRDRYFSRFHFLVELNPPVCRIMDLNSRNGTFLNSKRVKSADLCDGDLIRAGQTAIRVHIDAPNEAPPESPASTSDRAMPSPESRVVPEGSQLSAAGGAANLPQRVAAARGTPSPQRGDELHDAVTQRRFGRFEILEEIGRGGMGVVYRAKDSVTDRVLALKTILPAGPVTDKAVQLFLREAQILERLRHPHIVSFLECGATQQHLYLAMEYVAGTNAQHIAKGEAPLGVPRAVGWMLQLLSALDSAHRQGFVHRDIKPANLLIGRDRGVEHLKLADFGLARIYHASTLSGLTLEGDFGGTAPFMPPEQITNYRQVDPRSDIYSTGATLYYLLTRAYVYDFPPTPAGQMLLLLNATPVPVNKRRPDLPAALCQIIQRAIMRDPARRFATALEMHNALADCVS